MDTIDTIVIGAGVVGLAIARAMAQQGHEVIVLEQNARAGEGISSRNSGVIHAGIYYPADSMKAKLCVEGKQLLYDFCETCHVPYKRTGKLIVATSDAEVRVLVELQQKAAANGVCDLAFLDQNAVKEREPELSIMGALWSPSTGIVDVPQLILALIGQLESAGGFLAKATKVSSIKPVTAGFVVTMDSGDQLQARRIVNAAGLDAQEIAGSTDGLKLEHIPPRYMVRGNYMSLSGTSPFKTLVYPVPVAGGLGIHATLDMAGAVRFGPDVQPINREDYKPDESRVGAFKKAIARYWPGIETRDITPDYVGIRPQVTPPGVFGDFKISTEQEHGVKGLVNLFGIESPGLTAALAIGDYVASKLVITSG